MGTLKIKDKRKRIEKKIVGNLGIRDCFLRCDNHPGLYFVVTPSDNVKEVKDSIACLNLTAGCIEQLPIHEQVTLVGCKLEILEEK